MTTPASWSGNGIPHPLLGSGSALEDYDVSHYHFEHDRDRVLFFRETQRLDTLRGFKEDWDGRGSARPNPDAINLARRWLRVLYVARESSFKAWISPHVSASEAGEVVFEWWRGPRKLTLYFGPDDIEYIKVWGPNIDDEMESASLESARDFSALWIWLYS
jgi:hypothetical protein